MSPKPLTKTVTARDVVPSETEDSSADDVDPEDSRETHVLKMLYEGNVAEINRRDEQARKAKVYNHKHDTYRNTRCTNVAQEEHSALPASVFNVNQDSDDDLAYASNLKSRRSWTSSGQPNIGSTRRGGTWTRRLLLVRH